MIKNYRHIPGAKNPIKAWVNGVLIDDASIDQLIGIANLPFIYKHVAVMPDVHLGKGATIGSVIATKGAIVPAAVGVDIGCGMMATRTSLVASDLPNNLLNLRLLLEATIPHGRTDSGGTNDRGAHKEADDKRYTYHLNGLSVLVEKHPKLERAARRAAHHIGTLGSGNHFVEICVDEEQRVWVMLHTGSRGIGNAIGQHFITLAKKDMNRWFINLSNQDLAYIPQGSKTFEDYFEALSWAQSYAALNRSVMMNAALKALSIEIPKPFTCDETAINCHHNYVSWERHFGENVMITRKGAVNAAIGAMGIIPGSMGAKSFIVRGKGNHDSFCSCSHGAGRTMSRTAALAKFTTADHALATVGVECKKDASVLDETPMAYKDIDLVMAAQLDLVDIIHTLKQVVCIKG